MSDFVHRDISISYESQRNIAQHSFAIHVEGEETEKQTVKPWLKKGERRDSIKTSL